MATQGQIGSLVGAQSKVALVLTYDVLNIRVGLFTSVPAALLRKQPRCFDVDNLYRVPFGQQYIRILGDAFCWSIEARSKGHRYPQER